MKGLGTPTYRGNMHRVPPGVPRRWFAPAPSIPIDVFRRRRCWSQPLCGVPISAPGSGEEHDPAEDAYPEPNAEVEPADESAAGEFVVGEKRKRDSEGVDEAEEGEVVEAKRLKEELDQIEFPAVEAVTSALENQDDKLEVTGFASPSADKDENRTNLEKKLQTLNDKKHNLVQMLKQILNAEEEIKRWNMQAAANRAAMTPEVENHVDANSMARQTPKMTVEVNFGGDLGGESSSSHNHPIRQLHSSHSTSPSAAYARSPFGSIHHHTVYTPRSPASFSDGQTASTSLLSSSLPTPSPFSPPGYPSVSSNLPPVSLPTSSFITSPRLPAGSRGAPSSLASSPSPAASHGGSSVFTRSNQ